MRHRIESLDWLRGLMATSIMLYHLTMCYFPSFTLDSSALLGKLGVYGVSIFFVISGLSMAIVYEKFIKDVNSSIQFFIRRIFRIWPLLWIVIILYLYKNGGWNWKGVAINFTTLFGFIKPEAYINVGAWSIGNEMVYYSLTPFIIFLFNKKLILGNIFTTITVIIGAIFAFFLLSPTQLLSDQWNIYINPFNHLFLYAIGVSLFYNFNKVILNKTQVISVLIVVTFSFWLYPASGDQIYIVTGLNSVLISFISICLVFAFYKINFSLPKIFSIPLEQFGIATYGIYLLHPIVCQYVNSVTSKIGIFIPMISFIVVTIITVLIALISYNIFEKRLVLIGKRLTTSAGKYE